MDWTWKGALIGEKKRNEKWWTVFSARCFENFKSEGSIEEWRYVCALVHECESKPDKNGFIAAVGDNARS